MRKTAGVISALLLLALVLNLVGGIEIGGHSGNDGAWTAPLYSASATPDPLALGDTITVGTNTPFAPFEFLDGGGNLVGFTIDLVEEIGMRAGKTIIWVDYADWDALLEAGRTGAVNMIASSMTITAARETVYDFSTSYYSANLAVLVHTSSTLTCPGQTCTATELSGLTWVVQTGTTSNDWVRDNLGQDCATGGPLFCFGDAPTVIQTVKTGGADVAIMDLPAAVTFANVPANNLVAIGKIVTNDLYGMAVQEGDPLGILPLINPIIQQLIDEGFITQLEQVWGVPSDVSPLTAALRVGTILPLTGALSVFGLDMRDATDLAAEEINIGVLGGFLELLHRDSQAASAAAVDAATELVFVEGVPVIIGAAASSVSLPVAGVTVPNEVVQISPSSTSPVFDTFEPEEPGWFWRTVPSDALQGKVAGRYAFNDKGWRNVAILARDDAYGSGLAQAFQETFEGLGGTITVRVSYNQNAASFTTELTTIFNSDPEAIWWVAFPGEGQLIMTQWFAATGANPTWLDPKWLWSEGTKSQAFVDTLVGLGIPVQGMEGTAPIVFTGPNFETFKTAYLARYGKEPIIFAANTYDALYLAALAAVAREAVDSMSIRDSLIAVSDPPGTVVGPGPSEFTRAVGILEAGGNIDYEGASGRVNFDLVGNVGSDYEIWSISAAGQIEQVVVIPEEVAPGTMAPTASFTVTPPSGDTTTPFTFDASASSDPEDPVTALEVQWDWTGDGVWDTIWTGEKMVEHQYASPGTYTIRMRVRDTGTLMDSTTRQVEVASPPMGPWLDRIVWSEQADRSLALDQIIAGSEDAAIFGLTVLADKERALASDQIHRSSAFGIIDNFLMNPSRQDPTNPQFSENPFSIDEVRAAMQLLIDRDYIAREIWGGFALARGGVSFHPLSPDYRRGFADFLPLEERWSFDPQAGKDMMFTALQDAGWSIGGDNLWHDSLGNLVTIRGLIITKDERIQMGAYYADLLRGLNFNVEEERGPFPSLFFIATFEPPDQNVWNFYTAAFLQTATPTWDDEDQSFWGCGFGFESYCERRPADNPNNNVYTVNQELADIGDQLRLGSYNTLAERKMLIARGAELLMQAPIRVFIDARESLYVLNNRFQNGVLSGLDFSPGPTNPWFLKSATVPPEPAGAPFAGERVGRVLNQAMFVEGWNPWTSPVRLDDEVQRRAMTDFGMWRHPHTGAWIDIRNKATVVTAGPGGTLPVASDAVTFDTATNTWVTVPAGSAATSKVTLEMVFGNWHTGQPIMMDDIMYAFSNGWRRVGGDVSMISGLTSTASSSEVSFYQDQVVGLDVTSPTTLDVYLNFWHVDPPEIAGVAAFFPSYPWTVGELALQTMIDLETANNEKDATSTGRPWLDLTKGESLPFLAADLQSLQAANHIPPGMDTFITLAEATAQWAALDEFATAKGHYWPSNGPFVLEEVDVVNRQTMMVANRDYPWAADFWDDLATLPALREPQNLQAIPGIGQVGLTWQPPTSDGVSPITGYQLYRRTASGSLTLLVEVSNILSYTDTTVTSGVTYHYQISAVNAVGEGPRSNEATVDPVSPTISITSPAAGSALPSTSVTVTGTASDDVAVEKVELSTDAANWVPATGTASWSGSSLTLVEGSNTIYARATDTSGNTATVSIAVTVDTVKPTADAGEDQTANVGATISFDASASSDNVAIVSYEWDFGDGTTGTGETTTHTYAVPGTYKVALTVSDAAGNTDTDLLTVTIVDMTMPTANAGEDQTVNVGATVSFDASASSDNVAIVSYEWDFGDGTTGTGQATTHIYVDPGTYTVTLAVRDAAGNTDTDLLTVTVVDMTVPTVSITSPADDSNLATTSVTVSGTASDNVGVEKVELSLDGTNYVLATGTNSWSGTVTLVEGSNTIYARATDTSGNTATVSIAVTVDTVKPTADAGEDQTANVGATISFDASASSDNVAIVSYEWDFGDGTTGTGETTTHTYAVPGTYKVALTVSDAAGNTDTDLLTVTIETPPPGPGPSPPLATFAGIGVVAAAAAVALLLWRRRTKGRG